MKLKSAYNGKLGNQSGTKAYKQQPIVDPNSFSMSSGTDLISSKLKKKMGMKKLKTNYGALWTSAGPPLPWKPRHRSYMGYK